MRVACLFIPHFIVAIERTQRPELRCRPVVVGGTLERQRIVLDCSQEAMQFGIQIGMSLREALSRGHTAAFLAANYELYNETARIIINTLEQISPSIEQADLGQVYIGIDGIGNGADAETRLARQIGHAIKQTARLAPNIGIADSKFAAFAAAAESSPDKPHVIPSGSTPTFLAHLPVTYLPIPPDMLRRLKMFGLRTLGQLAKLPLGAVQAQFGPIGRLAWELANGTDTAPLIPQRYTATLAERLSFPSPVCNIDALLAGAGHLLARITNHPEFAYRAARGLVFKAILTNSSMWEHKLIFREPLASPDHMLFTLRPRLENASLPAPVEEIEIKLVNICEEAGTQGSLFASQRVRQFKQIDEAIQQIKARYGQTLIAKIVEVEPWSRIPERRLALIDYDP